LKHRSAGKGISDVSIRGSPSRSGVGEIAFEAHDSFAYFSSKEKYEKKQPQRSFLTSSAVQSQ